ncbi:G-protein coupled receptor 143-like isoform X2 [Galleria mellonella]|uniref:G-protein coupled receptor 143-like isoform X2 n=1 Tax=Galleria mellonella TaxID=7137 RepID=A0ABM3N1S5_GALME|nr:G-protein coupled receptor 143-like isoform X2 [Galleria mellonella]
MIYMFLYIIYKSLKSEFYRTFYKIKFFVLFKGVKSIFPGILSGGPQRWQTQGSIRGRHIIIWLAIADLFASFGILLRSALWLQYKNIMPMPDDDVSVLFCSIVSAWTQYFYTATWFWTLFYAIDTWFTIRGQDSYIFVFHLLAWSIPVVTTGIGLSILYFPDATCHNLTSISSALYKILPNYCATYIPITIVMIVNPIVYVLAGKNVEMAVALPLAQFTSKERRIVDTLRLKFFLINVVFYVCWLPNLVNGVLIWTMWFKMPVKVIIIIWYIMAFLNPMQALFNALVYRKWNKNTRGISSVFQVTPKECDFYDEQSPLLGSEPSHLQLALTPPAINNYATI